MPSRKESMVGCGQCGRLLPSSSFPQRKKAANIKLANMWVNVPCKECNENQKNHVKDLIVETVIVDGIKVHKLPPVDLGARFDNYRTNVERDSWKAVKL